MDTGARINFVPFDITPLTPAKHPLCLPTVDGSAMGCGDRKTLLELVIPLPTGVPSLRFEDTFYCAHMDPKFDIILSYPSLWTHKLGVLPLQNTLVWETEPQKLLLAGAQATFVIPRYDLVPARVPRASTTLNTSTPPTTPAVPKDTQHPSWCTSAYRVSDNIRDSIVDYFAGGTPSVEAFTNSTNTRFRRNWKKQQDAFRRDFFFFEHGPTTR